MQAISPVLAQAFVAQPKVLLLLGFVLFLTLLGLGLIIYIQRRILSDRDDTTDSGTLLADLRAMRDRGEISDDEYERTRAVMIAKATGKDPHAVLADSIRKQGGLVAEPGFDLTGQPLPQSRDEPEQPPGQTGP
tara:strand:- start:1743 stop:2144 length:402 start_codon:yes stop_codon:yes gene_type:complete